MPADSSHTTTAEARHKAALEMADTPNPADAEFSAIRTLYAALEPLDDDARSRVVTYIVARLEITLQNWCWQSRGHEGVAKYQEESRG